MNEIIATVLIASMGVYSVTFMPDYDKSHSVDSPVVLSDDSFLSSDTPFTRETPRELPPASVPEPRPETKKPVQQPVVPENRTTEIEAPTVFGLKDCRQTQSEDSHHTEKGGHSFALDLACVRGVSYDVPAPHFKDFYIIEAINHDTRLGDYLILKHGEERYVFGHTQTSRKVGERVQSGDIIGQSNNSGHSFGVHTHAEYWSGKVNKTFEGKRTNEFSSKLCSQRGWNFCKPTLAESIRSEVIALSSEIIRRYEGLHFVSYWDVKGYSIGYGTPSYQGEKITKEEAIKRFEERLGKTVDMVRRDFPKLSSKQQSALVSLAYNCNKGYQKIKAEGIQAHKTPGFCTLPGYGGLVKRRAEEAKLLFQ